MTHNDVLNTAHKQSDFSTLCSRNTGAHYNDDCGEMSTIVRQVISVKDVKRRRSTVFMEVTKTNGMHIAGKILIIKRR